MYFSFFQRLLCCLGLVASTTYSFSVGPTSHHDKDSMIVISNFIQKAVESSESFTLRSLTLLGPKAPRINHQRIEEEHKDRLRGCIRQVQGRIIRLEKRERASKSPQHNPNHYLQATFKFYGATDIVKNWSIPHDFKRELERVLLMPHERSKDSIHSEWGNVSLNPDLGLQSARLVTTQGTWTLIMASQKQKKTSCSFVPLDNDGEREREREREPQSSLDHDRKKQVLIDTSEPFLQKLGIVDAQGNPKVGMTSKYSQCCRFVEIMGHLIESSLSNGRPSLTTVDMGCGKAYLTFALHTYLMNKFSQSMQIITRGVDVRPKLITQVNSIAKNLSLSGLDFVEGTIESSLQTDELKPLDILVALHACDTATDDAIWYGILHSAEWIVTAPCCHKQVRSQMDPFLVTASQHPMKDILRHGIYRERMAEMVTDSLRALLLEYSHYDVIVFEFIGGEHTSKNVMIAATRRKVKRQEKDLTIIRDKIYHLASLHGIKRHRLAEWMGIRLSNEEVGILTAKKMPPL